MKKNKPTLYTPLRIMKKTLLFFLLLIFSGNLSAQEAAKPGFSLQEAINYALEHQPSVINASIEEKIAKQQVNEIKGLGTPQINGNAEINNFLEIPTSFVPAEFVGGEPGSFFPVRFGLPWTASVGVNATQLIFDGTYLVGLKATKTFQELSRTRYAATRVDAAINVSKAYYGVLVLDERKKIVDANIDRVNKLLSDSRELYKNGFAEKVDVDRLELSYNNLVVERDKIDRVKSYAYGVLKFQMGLDHKIDIQLTDQLSELQIPAEAPADSADVTKRPEYAVFKVQRQLNELDLKRYKAQYYPSLVAFGTLSANAGRDEFDILDTDQKWFPTAIIGLKLNVPIWDGLQRSSRVNMSKLKLMQTDNSIIQMKNGIQLEYTNAAANFDNYKASLQTTKKNRELAAEIARVSRIKYENGVGSSLEVTDAETSLREADANYFNTLYETIIAKIELDKAAGNLKY